MNSKKTNRKNIVQFGKYSKIKKSNVETEGEPMPEIDRRLAAAAVIILLLGFIGGVKYQDVRAKKEIKEQALLTSAGAGEAESKKPGEIMVYITGAVNKPGVFMLQEGERVYRAVELAGGLAPEADARNINLAAVLQDGKSYSIPAVGETTSLGGTDLTGTGTSEKDGKVNVNTASSRELESLPGIGPALAERIVEYRMLNGPFQNVDELKKVSGIGDKKFAAIKDQVSTK